MKMSQYLVKTELGEKEWQEINHVRHHCFICDDRTKDAGPNPVEYLCASVNSCIVMSAGMVAKSHHLALRAFKLENKAKTEDLGAGRSAVTEMQIKVHLLSSMEAKEKEKFLAHVLQVSTVYQTLRPALKIAVKLA